MNLNELFPEKVYIEIDNNSYEIKYNTRAMMALERDYPDITRDEKFVSSSQRVGEIITNAVVSGMKASDIINMVYAGLLHTGLFKDKKPIEAKEWLIDRVQPPFNGYVDKIVAAYMNTTLTPEMREKLDVMSFSKKKEPATEA